MRAKVAKAIRKLARSQTTIMFDSFNRKAFSKTDINGKQVVVYTYFRDKGTYRSIYKRLKKEYKLGTLKIAKPELLVTTNV